MENNELDQLFRAGLSPTETYLRPEEQWEVVASRLAAPERRRALWWWLGGGSMLLILSLFWMRETMTSIVPEITAWKTPLNTPTSLVVNQKIIETPDIADSFNTKSSVEAVRIVANASSDFVCKEGMGNIISLVDKSGVVTKQPDKSGSTMKPIASPASNDFTYRYPQIKTLTWQLVEEKQVRNLDNQAFEEVKSLGTVPVILPTPALADEPAIKAAPSARFSLHAGVLGDFIPTEEIDQKGLQYKVYGGVAMKVLPHWQIGLQYSQGNVLRTIKENPENYNIPIVDPPEETAIPSITVIEYCKQNLDLTLAYQVGRSQHWRFSLFGTLQWNNNTNITAVYDYNGVYLPTTVSGALPNSGFGLSAFSGGIELVLPITDHLLLNSRYQQYYSFSKHTFQWPVRHQVQLGAIYQF